MFPESVIDTGTIQAYLATHFHVHGATPATLHIGVASPALATLHAAAQVNSSTFISACNPYSQECDAATNLAHQATLAAELRASGLVMIDGIGQHPSGTWPGEDSFLVLDLSLEAARALGIGHQQNAIVWCGPDAIPQLILLR